MNNVINQINALLPQKRLSLMLDAPEEPPTTDDYIDFSFGEPNIALFPLDLLKVAANSITKTDLQYCPFRGHHTLLTNLSTYLSLKNSIEIHPSNLVVTNGAMDALGLLGLTLLENDDVVLVEDPTYFRALRIFRSLGADIYGIHLDNTGLNVKHLKNTLKKLYANGKQVKFLYLIPTHQNPSGTTLTIEKRNEIIALSNKYNFIIIEDDVYSELTYDGTPPSSLYRLSSATGNVVQVGTISKILSPGLKIGWILTHPHLASYLVDVKIDGGTNPIASSITAYALAQMDYDQRLMHLRKFYKHRRDTIIKELSHECIDFMEWTYPTGGFYVWVKLRKNIDPDKFKLHCIQEKVNVLNGTFFAAHERSHLRSFRLAFCSLEPEQIAHGIKRLHIAASKSIIN